MEPSLQPQLFEARANILRQVDRLEARPYGFAPIGLVRGGEIALILFLFFGVMACVSPFRANGVLLDNGELVARLARLSHDIEDLLEDLDPTLA